MMEKPWHFLRVNRKSFILFYFSKNISFEVKTMKKIISICLAVVIIICFAGCGSTNSENNNIANNQTVTEHGTIKLGVIASLEGSYIEYGQKMQRGIKLAVDEINSNGGINGIKVEVEFANDYSNEEKLDDCVQLLTLKSAKVIFGAHPTSLFKLSREKAPEDMLMVNIVSAAMNLKNTIDIPLPYDGAERAQIFASYISKNKLANKVLSLSCDSMDPQFQETLCKELQEEGINTEQLSYSYSEISSFLGTNVIDLVNRNNIDFIFIDGFSEDKVITEIRKSGYRGTIMTEYLNEYGEAKLYNYDCENLKETLTLEQFANHDNSPKALKLINSFRDRYNESPDLFSAQAYSAVYVIKNTMEKAEIQSGDITYGEFCKKIMNILPETKYDGPLGKLTWDQSCKLIPEVKCYRFDGDKYILN